MAPHVVMKFLSKAICCSKLKTLYIYNLLSHWALSNCCDPLWDTFHTPMIKITYTPHIFCQLLHWKLRKNISPIHTYHPTNKTPCYSWPLSPSYHFKMKDIGYAKRNKCHAQESMMKKKSVGHMKVQSIYKKRERELDTWRSKYSKKRERDKDSPCPKKEIER